MCNMCNIRAIYVQYMAIYPGTPRRYTAIYTPVLASLRFDIRPGRARLVDMAQAGDSMTQIADDELMRIQKIGEALAGLKDKKVVACLTPKRALSRNRDKLTSRFDARQLLVAQGRVS